MYDPSQVNFYFLLSVLPFLVFIVVEKYCIVIKIRHFYEILVNDTSEKYLLSLSYTNCYANLKSNDTWVKNNLHSSFIMQPWQNNHAHMCEGENLQDWSVKESSVNNGCLSDSCWHLATYELQYFKEIIDTVVTQ